MKKCCAKLWFIDELNRLKLYNLFRCEIRKTAKKALLEKMNASKKRINNRVYKWSVNFYLHW